MVRIERIERVSRIHFRDNGQHIVSVHWLANDGTRGQTEGNPKNLHIQALMHRARREGVVVEPEQKWG